MICAISGEVPEDPVVSKKSGILFERRLIEHHIAVGKLRPPQAASIPGLLGMFQNEWDALMLSNFALENQLHTARQELSHALYQHDAACRAIARLKKERDEARMLLSQSERQIRSESTDAVVVSNGKRDTENEMGPVAKRIRPGINPNIIAELTECNALLSGQRKKRQIPATLASVDALDEYTQVASHPLHKSNKPGILSIDIDASKDVIATGGIDATGVLFNSTSGQVLSTLTGHSKKVTSVKLVPGEELIITGSGDKEYATTKNSNSIFHKLVACSELWHIICSVRARSIWTPAPFFVLIVICFTLLYSNCRVNSSLQETC